MKNNIITLFSIGGIMMAGCTKSPSAEHSWATDPEAVRIEASVGALTKTNPTGTDEEQTKFNGPVGKFLGDEIAVSIVDNSAGQEEKTVTYRFDGEIWNPVQANDYLVWKAPVTYKAWYPASSKNGFTLPTDQRESNGSQASIGSSAKADFMTGEYVCDSHDNIPSDHKLRLVMNRKMALVTVNVDKNRVKSEFADKSIYIIRVESIQSGHSVVSADGIGSGDAVDVMPGPYDSAYQNGKGSFNAIVVPCDGDASARFLKITVGWRSDSNPLGETKDLYVTGRPAFEAGKHYTYNVILGKDKIENGNVSVNAWSSEVDLGGGKDYSGKKPSEN